ncbi:helix-turn-helix domain-containing protein [Amycolatopsis nigrescens]|uniref:helix-turn-helix domain-containing protein n=1 Tax=Amycolatopsis nigrescens TaxID=381445 RepID=UPI001FE16B59|nr:helix-turn-helix transcriptional regulator [Amycolatopsis nigrescens]
MNPTAVKRWIGLELKRLREAAGHDRAAAAERIGKATTVIAHIETARNLPAPADLELLLDFYGAPDLIPVFREMVRRGKRGKDWWIKFNEAVPEFLNIFLGLETGAARISSADINVVPGLFQTRDYAFTIHNMFGKRFGRRLSDEEIEAKVDLRMTRQATVVERSEDAPQIWSILDEGALRRQVGGPAIMRAQLERLAQLTERPNVDIQVLPFTEGAHLAIDGTFTIFDYPSEFVGDPGTVYIETRTGGEYYERPDQVRDFRNAFERLQGQAENPDRSRDFILSLAKEMV